jgi:hypothetical protein
MNFKTLAKHLTEASEAIERLSCGEDGMLPDGTTEGDVCDLFEAVTNMASFLEDELGSRLTRTDDREVEDMVECWFQTASKVDARRGEA